MQSALECPGLARKGGRVVVGSIEVRGEALATRAGTLLGRESVGSHAAQRNEKRILGKHSAQRSEKSRGGREKFQREGRGGADEAIQAGWGELPDGFVALVAPSIVNNCDIWTVTLASGNRIHSRSHSVNVTGFLGCGVCANASRLVCFEQEERGAPRRSPP